MVDASRSAATHARREPLRVLTALPVYNEERHVLGVLEEVVQHCDAVLVVDDGSTDRTSELLETVADRIHTERHPRNQGYGAALRTAFRYALAHADQFDVLVTIDCDGQHQPRLIPELAQAVFPVGGTPVDIISGSRYLAEFVVDTLAPEDRRRINFEITRQINHCFGLSLTDTFCGFKAYRIPALAVFEITELGYAMPLQLWVQAVRAGLAIREFPVPRVYLDASRSFGGSLDDAERRLAYYKEVIRREMKLQEVECGGHK